MTDFYWTCPTCGFDAKSTGDADWHLKEYQNDPSHKAADRGSGLGGILKQLGL